MTPQDYIAAARVPDRLKPQAFGLWTIRRVALRDFKNISIFSQLNFKIQVGFDSYTLLHRITEATMHQEHGEIVMEDSLRELRNHLPIWLNAKGRVLVNGLGLGCVVRGLLASPEVEHITAVEIDANILRVVGHEFKSNRRVRLIHGDAFKVEAHRETKFDYAWHDLWTDGDRHLQSLHAELLHRFHPHIPIQGAWALPRFFKRRMPEWVLR